MISQRKFVPTCWKGGGKQLGTQTGRSPGGSLLTGFLAGLRLHPEDCGIFPRTDEFGTCADDLTVDPREFQGYGSVEADDGGYVEVQRFVERGRIKQLELESYSELRTFLGERPGPEQIWHRYRKIRGGKVKKRLIFGRKSLWHLRCSVQTGACRSTSASGHCQKHTRNAFPAS